MALASAKGTRSRKARSPMAALRRVGRVLLAAQAPLGGTDEHPREIDRGDAHRLDVPHLGVHLVDDEEGRARVLGGAAGDERQVERVFEAGGKEHPPAEIGEGERVGDRALHHQVNDGAEAAVGDVSEALPETTGERAPG